MELGTRQGAIASFLLLVLPLVVYCALRVPLGQVPDEPTHVARIDSVLHGQILGHRVPRTNPDTGATDAGVIGNIGLAIAATMGNGAAAPLPTSATAAARLAWAEAIPWAPAPQFISAVNTAAYAPIAYLPAAGALGLAILCGARPHAAAIAARFGNVLGFALLGLAALALTARGALLLLMVLGLPMTVWLAGSCSQDGVLIALSVLALALLSRPSRMSYGGGILLLAILALQKPPFVALMLLAFAAPGAPGTGLARRVMATLLISLPALLWSALVMQRVSVPLLPGGPYHPGPLWPGDPTLLFRSAIASAQLKVVMHHPLTAALLPLTGGAHGFPSLWVQMIGVLGPFTLPLSDTLYALFTLALLSAGAALLAETAPAPGRGRALLVLVAALGAAELIFFVEYLTWTPVGMARIDGVQGRYFVPLLPLLLLLIPQLRAARRVPTALWWITPILALLASDLALPALIMRHYYA
ncbi:DUF2142 domain-containing protein [Acidisoma sp. 7E03]